MLYMLLHSYIIYTEIRLSGYFKKQLNKIIEKYFLIKLINYESNSLGIILTYDINIHNIFNNILIDK